MSNERRILDFSQYVDADLDTVTDIRTQQVYPK